MKAPHDNETRVALDDSAMPPYAWGQVHVGELLVDIAAPAPAPWP